MRNKITIAKEFLDFLNQSREEINRLMESPLDDNWFDNLDQKEDEVNEKIREYILSLTDKKNDVRNINITQDYEWALRLCNFIINKKTK